MGLSHNNSLGRVFFTVSFFLLVQSFCTGQEPGATTTVSADELRLEERIAEEKIDLIIEEPTAVTEVVGKLIGRQARGINVVLDKLSRDVQVLPMRLESVSIQAALHAICHATDNQLEWDFDGDGEYIYIAADSHFVDMNETKVHVINVSHILTREDLQNPQESMLSAIEIGLEMNNSSPKNLNVKLHGDTKLLFIRAGKSDADLVYGVLEQLGGESLRPQEAMTRRGGEGGGMNGLMGGGGGGLGGAGIMGGGGGAFGGDGGGARKGAKGGGGIF